MPVAGALEQKRIHRQVEPEHTDRHVSLRTAALHLLEPADAGLAQALPETASVSGARSKCSRRISDPSITSGGVPSTNDADIMLASQGHHAAKRKEHSRHRCACGG